MRSALQILTPVRHAQYVMGTLVEITGYCDDDDEDSARAALQEAMLEFEALERLFSRFDPESELCRVNREARTTACAVSPLFFEIVELGIRYSSLSGSSFSIALGPLVQLWNACAERQIWPAEEKVMRARRLSSHALVDLDSRHRTIRFRLPGMGLNLDGFVKGVATDRARDVLRNRGIPRAVINAGSSNISVYGFDDGEACRVGLRHPADVRRLAALLTARDASVSSSGTGPQAYSLGGRSLSHLIDPESGYPIERILSATAVTESAALAEAASKMVLFRGIEESARLFEAARWDVGGIRMEPGSLEYRLPAKLEVEVLHDACPALAE